MSQENLSTFASLQNTPSSCVYSSGPKIISTTNLCSNEQARPLAGKTLRSREKLRVNTEGQSPRIVAAKYMDSTIRLTVASRHSLEKDFEPFTEKQRAVALKNTEIGTDESFGTPTNLDRSYMSEFVRHQSEKSKSGSRKSFRATDSWSMLCAPTPRSIPQKTIKTAALRSLIRFKILSSMRNASTSDHLFPFQLLN